MRYIFVLDLESPDIIAHRFDYMKILRLLVDLLELLNVPFVTVEPTSETLEEIEAILEKK